MIFESEVIKNLGQYWAGVSIFKIVALLICFAIVMFILIRILQWFKGGTRDIFEFHLKKLDQNDQTWERDKLRWEMEISKRVGLLDTLKKTEVRIREELDTLHELKKVKDETGERQ